MENRNAGGICGDLCDAAAPNSLGIRKLQDNFTAKWHRLVPFGQYAHRKGMQVVNAGAAHAMINYFNSLRGKLMRKFLGLPIYIGHPDDRECENAGDGTVYGRVENLKIRDGALWALLRWTKLGQRLFSGGFLRHLSPRWMMRKISDRIFQPIRLISIGMTNHPNLYGEGDVPAGQGQGPQAIENTGSASEVCGKNEIKGAPHIGNDVSSDAACAEDPNCKGDADKICAESGDIPNKEDSTVTPDGCGKNGGGLHIDSLTENLSKRPNGQSCGDRILALVHEQMINFGDDYQSAWNAVKRRFPALFREKF
ncbi:MAG: phage protease [Puniceicoccales bacterium]|nr:phage protease [Puniceicoccales bacterium]